MTVTISIPEKLARASKFLAVCSVLLACSAFLRLSVIAQQRFTLPDNPTFKPEVEVRQEDYAKARREFRTRLVRGLPSPQAVTLAGSFNGWKPQKYFLINRERRLGLPS